MAVQRGIGALGIAGFVIAVLLIGWISGRFGQRVFDDEVMTLAAIETRTYLDLLSFYLGGGDVHPPLPFLWFKLLQDLQVPLWAQRVLSLAIAAAGFALILDLAWRRLPVERAGRVLALVLFLGTPLLYGMGASLRWYPLLVLPVALGIWSALRAGHPTVLSAVGFGVAANISFLAVIPAAAFVIWRWAIARRFDTRQDGSFIAVALILALPGLVAFALSLSNLGFHLGGNALASITMTALGVVGGYGLGLTHAPIALPFVLMCGIALIGALKGLRDQGKSDLIAISLLVVLFCLVLSVLGFAKPRSFLFAVPFLLAIVALGIAGLSWRRGFAWVASIAAVTLSLPVLWLLDNSDRPFKRNLHIPDEEILATIRQHAPKEASFVVSSDPSLGWRLRREGYCVTAASLEQECARKGAPVIVMIDDGTFTQRWGFSETFGGLTLDYKPAHQQLFGDDEDGPTKTFLSGRLVPKWLVSVAVYKRD